jgi:hypothetical protein
VPRFGVFATNGGDGLWMARRVWRWARTMGWWTQGLGVICVLVALARKGVDVRILLRRLREKVIAKVGGVHLP